MYACMFARLLVCLSAKSYQDTFIKLYDMINNLH